MRDAPHWKGGPWGTLTRRSNRASSHLATSPFDSDSGRSLDIGQDSEGKVIHSTRSAGPADVTFPRLADRARYPTCATPLPCLQGFSVLAKYRRQPGPVGYVPLVRARVSSPARIFPSRPAPRRPTARACPRPPPQSSRLACRGPVRWSFRGRLPHDQPDGDPHERGSGI